jgi:murein DD-endopeptidase MepM/ murein hydrolase activator NlpD
MGMLALAFALYLFLALDPPVDPSSVPLLRNAHFRDPLVGGVLGGYAGDTGLDIGGKKLPVYAIAAGTLDYAEWGHTQWMGPKDTAYCARLTLDEPVPYRGHTITHVYYAHMSALAAEQPEHALLHRHVEAGERLGTSGIANGSWHLHLGLLLDGHVEQDDWQYILRENEVRAVLGGYANGSKI